jgi:hypothetical protein
MKEEGKASFQGRDNGQGARPKPPHELKGPLVHLDQLHRSIVRGTEDGDGPLIPLLGIQEPPNSILVGGIAAEPIYGVGGVNYQSSLNDHRFGAIYRVSVKADDDPSQFSRDRFTERFNRLIEIALTVKMSEEDQELEEDFDEDSDEDGWEEDSDEDGF